MTRTVSYYTYTDNYLMIAFSLHSLIDELNDRIEIPCDSIKETLAALKVITKGNLQDQITPIHVFIQVLLPKSSPLPGNCRGLSHTNIKCSECNKVPVTGFIYGCLQCHDSKHFCGECEASGCHPEHFIIRYYDREVRNIIQGFIRLY